MSGSPFPFFCLSNSKKKNLRRPPQRPGMTEPINSWISALQATFGAEIADLAPV
jgi:hypothetical protein